MMKLFIGAMGGVFVGAFLMEILRRKRPETFERIHRKAQKMLQDRDIAIVVEYDPVD
jgi:hypothetical protein